jgi:Zn-dependent peptidase ImmA (M78 family)/transcriptional regulator with XRE-family HTH domain
VSEIGKRLKSARAAKGLSVRKFAEGIGEDFAVVSHIEHGKRFPPKSKVELYAEVLSLTVDQLIALMAVERRGLDPFDLLPEFAPAPVPNDAIEAEAEKALKKFGPDLRGGPVQVERVIKSAYGLTTQYLDFSEERIEGRNRRDLYGCLIPDGYKRHDKAVLVNSGEVNGHKLPEPEKRVTVAHEAGHFALHYGNRAAKQLFFRFSKEPTYCRASEIKPSSFNLKEHQANLFAACLLMPRHQFQCEWQKLAGDASQLAVHFNVTEKFVRLRAELLKL